MRTGREPKVTRAIIAAMATVGPDGISMQELIERAGSTQKSLRTLLSRLRDRGHPFWVVRRAAGVRVHVLRAHERPMQQLPLITQRLAEAGDAGLLSAELGDGIRPLSFNRSKCRAAKDGVLFSARRGDVVRYFGTAAARDAFLAAWVPTEPKPRGPRKGGQAKAPKPPRPPKAPKPPKPPKAPRLEKAAKPPKLARPLPAGKPKPPAPVLAFLAQPADYSRAVRTVCPSGRDLRHVAELGPGYRSPLDPAQCRPWAQAATGVAA